LSKKYTKAQARRACVAIQRKLNKLLMSQFIGPQQFVKLTEPYERLRKKLK